MRINTKALLKAMSYLFLPTAAVFFLLFMAFLDLKTFWTFISGNGILAMSLRIVLTILEFIVCYTLYQQELKYIISSDEERAKLNFYSDHEDNVLRALSKYKVDGRIRVSEIGEYMIITKPLAT